MKLQIIRSLMKFSSRSKSSSVILRPVSSKTVDQIDLSSKHLPKASNEVPWICLADDDNVFDIVKLFKQVHSRPSFLRSSNDLQKSLHRFRDFKYSTFSLEKRNLLASLSTLRTPSRRIHDSTKDKMSVPLDTEIHSPYVVGHDKAKNNFYIKLREPGDEDVTAMLCYNFVRPGVVDMYETYVPKEFRGQGIAKILAAAAFDHFCEEDVLIRPSCTYLQKFYRENPLPRYKEHVDREYA